MIIYLDPKTYQFLNNYALKSENVELELRFGKYKDGKFKPDIGKETYLSLGNYLRDNKKVISKIDDQDSKVEIFSDGIRKVYQDGNILYQKKNKIYTGDIEYKDFVLRLSESEELNISTHIDREEDIIETRYRKRTIYNQLTFAFYYMLTEITTLTKNYTEVTYELEIEYNVKPVTLSFLTRMVQDSINNILPFLIRDKQVYSYLPLSEESYIKDQYMSLYIKEPKPVNLTRYITPDLQNMGYSVTNKLDGERFILLFTKLGFYAFNNRKVDKYDTKNYVPQENNSFIFFALDSEFFEGRYYIFDCMIYGGQKIIDKNHDERLVAGQDIVNKISIPNNFLTLKNFYRGNLKNDTENLLGSITKQNNDGLIYTSNGKYNSNIYKWKFPEKMSIDFSVYKISKISSQSQSIIYELYVKDNLEGVGVNVPFHGNSTYELVEALYNSDKVLKEGGIYEFGYNIITDKFLLFRDRPDKIDPNFITVAENVWNDIKNPYTSIELINLLSPKVLEQYRKYQNNIKRSLIEEYCTYKNVLDLGSGRGGDLGKYDSVGVNHLWCVEPNEKNYTELLRRLSERKVMKNKTTLIKTIAQDTDEIVKGIRNTLVYDVPVLFKANVFLKGSLASDNPTINKFASILDFTSLDHLKTVISEVLNGEFGVDMAKNSFIVDNDNDEMVTDEYLFDSFDIDNFKIFIRYAKKGESQELGGDYKNWFPRSFLGDVNYDNLKITDEGMYSLTKYIDSIAIIRAMKNIIGEENIEGLTIMDGTANVGGDTIRFAMNFNKVISVELDKDNYDVLLNNVEVYNLRDKVSLINDDVTKVYNNIQLFPDVLYLDPPWGGKGYKEFDEEKMVIFLSNISLTRFIGNVLISPSKPKYIFIKLPINYNVNSLRDMPYVCDMQVYSIRKFYLVCMTIDNKYNPLKKADILTSFFSLSFFFFRDDKGVYTDLENLVNTIDKTITDGGYFIGTTIDGTATKKLLESSPNKKFDFDGGYIKFIEEKYDDNPVIELLIKDTIVETQRESLVDFEILQLKLAERDIYLEQTKIFSDSELLTDRENILNSLYRYFVFRKSTKRQIYMRKALDEIKNIYNSRTLKDPLTTDEIMNVLSIDEFRKCQTYVDQLTSFNKHTIQDYRITNFNYTPDWSRVIYSKSYKSLTNIYKEYFNGIVASTNKVDGILKPSGVNKSGNYTSFNLGKNKSFVGFINKIFSNRLEIILSCLYQLYNTVGRLTANDVNMNLTNPVIFLTKDDSITSIPIDEPLSIRIIDGLIVNILNYSYTLDTKDKTVNIEFPFFGDLNEYPLIEILQYLPDSYRKNIYYLLEKEDSEFVNFLIKFIDIQNRYLDFSHYHRISIYNGIMGGYNDTNEIQSLNQSFELQYDISKLETQIESLVDEDYEYFEKMTKELNKHNNKISNKIYKWLEVLKIGFDKYKLSNRIFSNGYMPHMFLYAMKSYLDKEKFEWYSNNSNNSNIDEKDEKDVLQCDNAFNIDTSDIRNIDYLDRKMNRGIDIYASYTNKNNDDLMKFLGDILLGLVSLREGGTMLFNMKSFFRLLEISVLGVVCDMFKYMTIVKPYFSRLTDSEVYIICEGYEMNDAVITLFKTLLKEKNDNVYIKNSLNVKKYSGFLIACYTFYGRQKFFMEKDIELYNRLKKIGLKYEDITLNNLRNSSDKFVSYYVKQRLEFNKEVKKIQDDFSLRKWDNYGCKPKKILQRSRAYDKNLRTFRFSIHPSIKGVHQPLVFKDVKISGVYDVPAIGKSYEAKNNTFSGKAIFDVYKLLDGKFQEQIVLHNYDRCCKDKQPPIYNKLTRITQEDIDNIDNKRELDIVVVPLNIETPCPLKCPNTEDEKECRYFKLKTPLTYYQPSNTSITIGGVLSDKEYIYYTLLDEDSHGFPFPHPLNKKRKFNIIRIYNDETNKWNNIMLEDGWKQNAEVLSERKDLQNVKVIGTVFSKAGSYGDFEWQIKSGKFEDSLFLFNDDEDRNHHKKAGKGNAIIRKYNKYAIPDRPRAVGIVTGKDGKGYTSLTDDVKKSIDSTIKEAKEIIRKFGYTKVYYSADTENGLLGTSIFKVDKKVLEYITKKIKSLGEINWGSLEDSDIDFSEKLF